MYKRQLFHNGFSTGHGYLREPNAISSYAALACIAIQANQNEMHGGQSVPNFDYSMAQGVDKTYSKEYFKALIQFFQAVSYTHLTPSRTRAAAPSPCGPRVRPALCGPCWKTVCTTRATR